MVKITVYAHIYILPLYLNINSYWKLHVHSLCYFNGWEIYCGSDLPHLLNHARSVDNLNYHNGHLFILPSYDHSVGAAFVICWLYNKLHPNLA